MDERVHLIDEAKQARLEGRLEEAVERYQQAAAAIRGRPALASVVAHIARHVGDIQRELGEFDAAEANYAEALAVYRAAPHPNRLDLANTLRGYALLRERLGDTGAAHAMWTEAAKLYTVMGIRAGVDEADRRLATLTKAV